MSQHYTSNTISAPKWCNRCKRHTQHRVGGDHKLNDCLVCLYKLGPGILTVDQLGVWDFGLDAVQRSAAEADHHSHVTQPAAEKQRELFA